jgi:hypothetical protein
MFPGLVGTELDMETGKFITFDSGWQAGVDSFIEVNNDVQMLACGGHALHLNST